MHGTIITCHSGFQIANDANLMDQHFASSVAMVRLLSGLQSGEIRTTTQNRCDLADENRCCHRSVELNCGAPFTAKRMDGKHSIEQKTSEGFEYLSSVVVLADWGNIG
jgi:hypothetical protein